MSATAANLALTSATTWVSLGAGTKGITVTAHRGDLVYCYAATTPSSAILGHVLGNGETFSAIPDSGHFVWVRSPDAVVSYTEVG